MRIRWFPRWSLVLLALAGSGRAQEDPTPSQGLTWKDLIGTDSTFQLYGFIRLDAMYDDSRFNDPLIPIYVQSEDPTAPSTIGAEEDDDEFALSARLTRLGLALDGPTVDGLGDPDVAGKIEVDFYNIGLGDSDSRNAFRMRLAYLELDWGNWSVLAGQDWDVVSPLYPIVNNDIMMWGAGNTGDRRPQLTAKYALPAGGGAFTTEFGIALAGAVGENTVEGGLRSGENSGMPMLNARVGYAGKASTGSYDLGVWGHMAEDEYDATASGEEDTYDSSSVGVDLTLPLFHERWSLMGEYWTGENLDDIRGGILQGVNATTGDEIEAQGGFAELAFKATEACTLYAGYSFDDPEDGDLDTGQRAKNEVPYVAARWRYGVLRLGLEVLDWTTEYVDFDDGDALRVVGWIAYYF
jgi:hypothetical protein